ncbi:MULTISPECIES: rhodanese-like domain-containing protein [Pontibacillus]|uniref:Rhodanese-like domain-containing protein n=1 Tax=Pontibacillus chungwhensis TaxID=265426 RepID=A0ABY8V398_9BACI|nr:MULTISPECIES: rhodanese-like domain-containing protein [Pontibacillus]MCD5322446.1 rhodanese-like domain-containing protein [Pontibacillus sp. HN14]WIF99732.1 rhodanese-like domain-containing protein [Pontibacillus chungwhensis]
MKNITPEEVRKKVEGGENINIVDVREPEEVEEGKIPGAKHIPLGSLDERKDELDKDKEYVMVCRSGGRSGKATAFLEENGYNVINMDGGMLAWEGSVDK